MLKSDIILKYFQKKKYGNICITRDLVELINANTTFIYVYLIYDFTVDQYYVALSHTNVHTHGIEITHINDILRDYNIKNIL